MFDSTANIVSTRVVSRKTNEISKKNVDEIDSDSDLQSKFTTVYVYESYILELNSIYYIQYKSKMTQKKRKRDRMIKSHVLPT